MRLNLNEIIEVAGASVSFECDMDTERLYFPGLKSFKQPLRAIGMVKNTAGALTILGTLYADMVCICDRCAKEFGCAKTIALEIPVAAELVDEENPDIFLLDGDWLDLTEVLETVFVLDMETKHLCSDDCAGLCIDCGANLNLGPCDCKKKTDPRLAVLEQLLDINDDK